MSTTMPQPRLRRERRVYLMRINILIVMRGPFSEHGASDVLAFQGFRTCSSLALRERHATVACLSDAANVTLCRQVFTQPASAVAR